METLSEANTDGTIIEFLTGVKSFEGVWYGDKHPNPTKTMKAEKTDNELIAEFMGEILSKGVGMPAILTGRTFFNGGNTLSGWEYLQYDKSFDWIMPVVHKIKTIIVVKERYAYGAGGCDDEVENFMEMGIATKIETVHKRSVEFIKWYNNQSVSQR